MKKFIKRLVLNKPLAALLIKPTLKMHSRCYKWAGSLAIILNDGIHPKHQILQYKEWFLENIETGWTILDVGCNTGLLASMLSEKAAFVYGIEISEQNVKTARSLHTKDNIEYICANATTHDYTNCRPIDCVSLSNVLEHIENRTDFLRNLIKNLNWVNNKQKRFLIRVPVIDREWIVPYKKQLGLDYRLDKGHYTEYTLESFLEELKQANIVSENIKIRFGEIYAVCKAL